MGRKPFQQLASGLVVRVLRYKLATECLGQQGWGQAIGGGLGGLQASLQAVGIGEEEFNAADDF